MMIGRFDFLALLYFVPFIAVIDWIIFQRWAQCAKCGAKLNAWYNFLLPSLIEILFFFAGFSIGVTWK